RAAELPSGPLAVSLSFLRELIGERTDPTANRGRGLDADLRRPEAEFWCFKWSDDGHLFASKISHETTRDPTDDCAPRTKRRTGRCARRSTLEASREAAATLFLGGKCHFLRGCRLRCSRHDVIAFGLLFVAGLGDQPLLLRHRFGERALCRRVAQEV